MTRLCGILLAAGLALAPNAVLAQARTAEIISPGQGAAVQDVSLPVNKSVIVNLPRDARDVLVANPDIVDAVIRTPRQAYLLGQAIGETSVYFLDSQGNQILDLEIRVERDMGALRRMLDRIVPDAVIQVEPVGEDIVLTGLVGSALEADRAVQVAQRFAAEPENVLSLLAIDGAEQVMLQVRIVEMQRSLLKQLGVNWDGGVNFGEFDPHILAETGEVGPGGAPILEVIEERGFSNNFGFGTQNGFGVSGGPQGGLDAGVGYTNLFGPAGDIQSQLNVSINALERSGLLRTLAEPNLTAVSGESAEFLAGGEFPVPVGRDRDGNLAIEFKQFGVGLSFTPVVLSGGRISLQIATEVSDLSNAGAIQLGGVSIPSLSVRSAQTSVELPSGGAIVIAGLIQEETRESIDGLPGLKDIPTLGALFRSNDFVSEQTELVVIATPYLVEPTDPDSLVTPIDGLEPVDGPEAFLLGRLNRVYAAPGADPDGRTWQGPYGFITEPGYSQ